MSKELTTPPAATPAITDVGKLLQIAIEGGLAPESMEALVNLQIKMRAEDARAAYSRDYAAMQVRLPPVLKNRHVQHNNSDYATLDHVERTVRPILGEHGFSYSFTTEATPDGGREAVCRLRHVSGHMEETRFPCALDSKAKMNDTQRVASAASYARRYALLFALGVSTTDTVYDDDANSQRAETITEKQAADLRALADEVGADKDRFLGWVRSWAPDVQSFMDIPAAAHGRVVQALEHKRAAS